MSISCTDDSISLNSIELLSFFFFFCKVAKVLDSKVFFGCELTHLGLINRYKREEVKIQAWESHQKRKAEMEMRRMEVFVLAILLPCL